MEEGKVSGKEGGKERRLEQVWEMVKGISEVPVQRRWVVSGDSDGEYRALKRRVRLGLEGPCSMVGWKVAVLSCGKP